jgi:hypothetical protein
MPRGIESPMFDLNTPRGIPKARDIRNSRDRQSNRNQRGASSKIIVLPQSEYRSPAFRLLIKFLL